MTTSQCRSCGKVIVWLKTSRGKSIPVDLPATMKDPDMGAFAPGTLFDATKHISHFATCPEAKKWRKKDNGK